MASTGSISSRRSSTRTAARRRSITADDFVIQAAAATGANVRARTAEQRRLRQAPLDEINNANAQNMLFVASAGNNTRQRLGSALSGELRPERDGGGVHG